MCAFALGSGERAVSGGQEEARAHLTAPRGALQRRHVPFALLTQGCESRRLELGLRSQDRY